MQSPMTESGLSMSIKVEDYNKIINETYNLKIENNRLKKLDENVKRAIQELDSSKPISNVLLGNIAEVIAGYTLKEALESLYE
jgi:urocanate hydratase